MGTSCDKIILCRGLPEENRTEDNYVHTLQSAGYSCNYLYTLRFEFINSSDLQKCLQAPENYHGLILTSQRAVEAIRRAFVDDKEFLCTWQKLPAYCVGPATHSLAVNSLGLECCLGSRSGNAKDLAEVIISHVKQVSKPLLYPCSDIARETIEQILSINQVNVHKLVAYRTLTRDSLEVDFLNIVKSVPSIFVFFSPSTVRSLMSVLEKYPNIMKRIKAVAIGPVTKQSLIDAGFLIYAIAAKPDPDALLQAIICALNNDHLKNI